MVSSHYLQINGQFTHAQTVCTKPFLREEGPEDKATTVVVSVSLFITSCDWLSR